MDEHADQPAVGSVFDGTEPVDWTPDDTVAFEVAREILGEMVAVVSGDLADARHGERVDQEHVDALVSARAGYLVEQARLEPGDRVEVARIRADYGARLRDRHAARHG